jgi:putative ABC transport system permease protein
MRATYRGREENTDENQFFFHWDYLNETLKKRQGLWADQVGFYVVGVAEPELTGEVAAGIDRGFRNSLAETLTETEKAFQQGFVAMTGAIISTIEVVSIMVIVIILAVVANTMAMTTRERIGEYAVLKTLGFKASHIAGLIFGESLVITTWGCLLGMTLTYPAADLFYRQLGSYFPVFNVEQKTLFLSMIASVLVGLAAAVIPARRAIRIRIAEGLRRIG